MITFFRGHPGNELLPSSYILEASKEVLGTSRSTDTDESTRHPLTYGADEGAFSVRESLARWTKRKLGCTATPDCLNLTNGASFGAATALLQCCPADYTRLAFSVSPTYFLMNDILANAGFTGRMKAVEETPRGLDISGFEQMLKEDFDKAQPSSCERCEGKHHFRYVLYIVPTFSNPGGYTLSLEERLRLLSVARQYDVLILCDEVYNCLDYGATETPPPLLVTLDRETLPERSVGNVVANFSMSKYLGPGLRVGWQEAATPKLAYHLSQSGATRSGGTPAQLNTFLVAQMLDTGRCDEVLDNLNAEYGRRAVEYRKALETYLPAGTDVTGGHGGYFFWVIFPDGYDIQAITTECKKRGIILSPGQHFEVRGDIKGWGKNCFRVSLSYHPSSEALPAIKIWGEVSAKNFRDETIEK